MTSAQNLTPLRPTISLDKRVVGDRLINVHEAARIAHRKEVTIYNAGNPSVGKLHPVRDQQGHVLFSEQEVRKMFGDSPVDRRYKTHYDEHSTFTPPVIKPVNDFKATIKAQAEMLLGEISVLEASLADKKKMYALVEPILLVLV